jgi:large subunit ribosomal protein L22
MSANLETAVRKDKKSIVIKKRKEEASKAEITQAQAVLKYVRISPRKVRIVINLIRGKKVSEALTILKFTPKAAAPIVEKLLNSAIANAENNFGLDKESLYVKTVYADQAAIMKRIRPRAQGRAFSIHKKVSHITVVVGEK